MIEINRLRARLKNVGKNVTEYRMTVNEASALLNEIDGLLKAKEQPHDVAAVPQTNHVIRIIDGGTL